jgi:U3 small nucleolar RNA-associated protein 14
MPGRQSHGRPLLTSSRPRTSKKSKSKARGKALDAFALAQEQTTEKTKGVRTRGLEPEPTERSQKKHRRDEDEDDEDEDGDGDDEAADLPRKKRAKNDDDSFNGLSEGSEGEEWHIGVGSEDDDSEIDSDDAFGDGDDERFDGFTFRGSSSKDVRGGGDGSDSDDGESLGSDAIDLAQALDQVSDDDESEGGSGSGSEEDDESSSASDSDEDSDDEEDPTQREALRKLITGFAGEEEDGAEAAQSTSQQRAKIGLKDLGLFGVKDPHIKKSLKLMNKEEKTTTRGTSKKLDVPLARRQQDKLERSAAYEKTSETLNRWTDTVKHNRRADHLFFPLAQNKQDAGLDNGDLLPLDKKSSATELEQTIMAIMEESGMGPSKPKDDKAAGDGEGQEPSVSREELKELWNQRRRERELHSRELARSKRIKKIKSKAYRRVHRKEQLRDEMAAKEAMAEAGEIDSEEEREAHDRRRAMERMGSKHKESKWAKMGSNARRAVWDEDFRAGLTDMARMDAELRRRVEGKAKGSDDEDDGESDASGDSGDGDERDRLLSQLNRAAQDEPAPKSGLMGMKFMQRGEEVMKKANDEMVRQIRRELASDDDEEDDEDEEVDIGRRQYGMTKPDAPKLSSEGNDNQENPSSISNNTLSKSSRPQLRDSASVLSQAIADHQSSVPGGAGAWSRVGPDRRKNKKASKNVPEELDLSNAAVLATKPAKPKQQQNAKGQTTEDFSEDEDTVHLPMAIKDQELIKRAFAGEDVVGEFEREKAELVLEDEAKTVDNTLPGWGSWVGEGVSNKDKKRHTGRFLTKVEGVKSKDRKDFKLDRVIVSEKRLRKVSNRLCGPETRDQCANFVASERQISRLPASLPV